MCIAIPLGQRDGNSGTRLGRWLRARPARILALTAVVLVAGGLFAGAADWPIGLLLAAQGLALPLVGRWLADIPRRCGGSEISYLRHGAIALPMGIGGASMLAGGPGLAIGALCCALAWRLAAKPLSWQLAWCHGRPSAQIAWVPRLMTGAALILTAVAVASLADAGLLVGSGAVLLCLPLALIGGLSFLNRTELV